MILNLRKLAARLLLNPLPYPPINGRVTLATLAVHDWIER